MADVTQGRYQQLLRRAFGLYATQRIADVVPPTISPTADVHDPYQPEMRVLRGERLTGYSQAITNTSASNFGVFQAINPIGSNKLWAIKRATWSFGTPTPAQQPGSCFIAAGTVVVPPGFVVNSFNKAKDSRYVQPAVSTGAIGSCGGNIGSTGTIAGFNNSAIYFEFVQLPATTSQFVRAVDLDVVLTTGSQLAFYFASDTLPAATYGWFLQLDGYERVLDPGELIAAPS